MVYHDDSNIPNSRFGVFGTNAATLMNMSLLILSRNDKFLTVYPGCKFLSDLLKTLRNPLASCEPM